jgi:hypothetical protein
VALPIEPKEVVLSESRCVRSSLVPSATCRLQLSRQVGVRERPTRVRCTHGTRPTRVLMGRDSSTDPACVNPPYWRCTANGRMRTPSCHEQRSLILAVRFWWFQRARSRRAGARCRAGPLLTSCKCLVQKSEDRFPHNEPLHDVADDHQYRVARCDKSYSVSTPRSGRFSFLHTRVAGGRRTRND